MTRGIAVLLFAYMLLVTATVSSAEADHSVVAMPPEMVPAYAPEKPHPYAPTVAPAYGPETPYPYAPTVAPAYGPETPHPHAPSYGQQKPHPYAPEKAPVYPPPKPIAPTPEAESPKRGCDDLCVDYCKSDVNPKKRWCQRVCSACCAKCDCVPEEGMTCKDWDIVMYHNEPVKCP